MRVVTPRRTHCLHRRNPVTVPIESGRRFRLKAVTDSEESGQLDRISGMGARNRSGLRCQPHGLAVRVRVGGMGPRHHTRHQGRNRAGQPHHPQLSAPVDPACAIHGYGLSADGLPARLPVSSAGSRLARPSLSRRAELAEVRAIVERPVHADLVATAAESTGGVLVDLVAVDGEGSVARAADLAQGRVRCTHHCTRRGFRCQPLVLALEPFGAHPCGCDEAKVELTTTDVQFVRDSDNTAPWRAGETVTVPTTIGAQERSAKEVAFDLRHLLARRPRVGDAVTERASGWGSRSWSGASSPVRSCGGQRKRAAAAHGWRRTMTSPSSPSRGLEWDVSSGGDLHLRQPARLVAFVHLLERVSEAHEQLDPAGRDDPTARRGGLPGRRFL